MGFFKELSPKWIQNTKDVRNVCFHGTGIVEFNVDMSTDFIVDVEITLYGIRDKNGDRIKKIAQIGYLKLFNMYQKLNHYYYWLLCPLIM